MANAADRNRDALQGMIAEICTTLNKWVRADVLDRHRIGRIIREVMASERTYGQHAVERIAARAIGYSTSWIYACADVAEAWDENELKEVLKERDAVREQVPGAAGAGWVITS